MVRIYPTFLVVFALYLILSAIVPDKSKIPADNAEAIKYIVQNLLFLPGIFDIDPLITVAWSLSYEFAFYIFLPLIYLILGMKYWQPKHRFAFFAVAAISYLILTLFYFTTYLKTVLFIAGILSYDIVYNFKFSSKLNGTTDILTLASLAVASVIAFLLVRSPQTLYLTENSNALRFLSAFIVFIPFAMLIVGGIRSNSLLSRIFGWTPLRWLGNISYSYFLIHGLVLNVIFFLIEISFPSLVGSAYLWWIGLPFFFALTWIWATILFLAIEFPVSIKTSPKTVRINGAETIKSYL